MSWIVLQPGRTAAAAAGRRGGVQADAARLVHRSVSHRLVLAGGIHATHRPLGPLEQPRHLQSRDLCDGPGAHAGRGVSPARHAHVTLQGRWHV